jgi:hypothetical protein
VFCHPRPFCLFNYLTKSVCDFLCLTEPRIFQGSTIDRVKKKIYINVFVSLISVFFVEYFLPCIGEGWLLHAVTKLGAFFRAASALHTYIEYTNLHTYSYYTAILYRLSLYA